MPAKRSARRGGDASLARSKDGIGDGGRGLLRQRLLVGKLGVARGQTLRPGGVLQRGAARHFGCQCPGRCFGRHDDLGDATALARGKARPVVLVAEGDFGIGRLGSLAQSIGAESGVSQDAAFGPDEAILVLRVILRDFRVARFLLFHKGERRNHQNGALPRFLQERGIPARHLPRHLCAKACGKHDLPRDQALRYIVANGRFAQTLLLQRLSIDFLGKLAVRAAKGWELGNFGIDQALAGDDAVILPEDGNCEAVYQVVEHLLQAIVCKERAHRDRRVFLARPIQRGVGRTRQRCGIDPLVAHHRDPIATGHAAEAAGVGDIAAGEGQSDENQESEHDADADLALEGRAE